MKTGPYAWRNGEIVPLAEASVPLLAHALHYGTAVFEGMRVYDGARGPAAFRHADHVERLIRSARLYGMRVPWSRDEIRAATNELVRRNGHRACYVRSLAYRGEGTMAVSPAGAAVELAIATWEWDAYLGEEGKRNGIRAKVSSWRRISGEALMPAAKATGHYLNSALAKVEVDRAGYEEAILLDARGKVSEASGANAFLVEGDVLSTPAATSSILPGITRAAAIEIAGDLGIDVREHDIGRAELTTADEVFLTGTAAELTPVREVDDVPIGSGRPGPLTLRLQSILEDAFYARDARYLHWADPIDDAADAIDALAS